MVAVEPGMLAGGLLLVGVAYWGCQSKHLPKRVTSVAVTVFGSVQLACSVECDFHAIIQPELHLSDEIMVHLFSYLDGESLLQAEQVSTDWHRIANDETLWEALYERDFAFVSRTAGITPKTDYLQRLRIRQNSELGQVQCTLSFEGHGRDGAQCVAWSPDSECVATGSTEQTVRIWSAATGEEEALLTSHGWQLLSLAWSADGTYLLTDTADGTLRLWNREAEEYRILSDVPRVGRWRDLSRWSPTGLQLIQPAGSLQEQVVDLTTGEQRLIMESVTGSSWSPDGTHIATIRYQSDILIWSIDRSEIVATLDLAPFANEKTKGVNPFAGGRTALAPTAVDWSPDGRWLATSLGNRCTVIIWSVVAEECVAELKHRSRVDYCHWSPDGHYLVTETQVGRLRLYMTDDWQCIAELDGRETGDSWCGYQCTWHRTSFSWSPDSRKFAMASQDHNILICAAETGEVMATISGHTARIVALAWSPDGSKLFSSSSDGQVLIKYFT